VQKVLNDLYDYDLKIYQGLNSFKFSLDSILLAEFVEFKSTDGIILDMCTGNAPIPLILSTKTPLKVVGFEIQDGIAKFAQESIDINNLENRIQIINDDIKKIKNYYCAESFEIITCNPPFFKVADKSFVNESEEKTIARHEIKINLQEIIEIASYALINKGSFYLVHRPERLQEILQYLTDSKLFAKKIQFVYTDLNQTAQIVLIKAVKNGNVGTIVNKPICVQNLNTYKNIF